MKSGDLRHRVKLQEVILTRDTAGSFTNTVSDVTTIWGSVEPLSAREIYEHQMLQQNVTHRIRIRKCKSTEGAYFGARYFGSRYFAKRYFPSSGADVPKIKADMLFDFKGRIFKVVGIRNILEIGAQEEVMVEEQPA